MGDLTSLGVDEARLAAARDAICRDIDAAQYDGAALIVHRRGVPVLEVVEGYADRANGRELSEDAVFATFSSTGLGRLESTSLPVSFEVTVLSAIV